MSGDRAVGLLVVYVDPLTATERVRDGECGWRKPNLLSQLAGCLGMYAYARRRVDFEWPRGR